MQSQLRTSTAETNKSRHDLREMLEARLKAEAELKFEKSQSETYQQALERLKGTLEGLEADKNRLETALQTANDRSNALNKTTEDLRKELNSARTQSQSSQDTAQMAAKLQDQAREAEDRHSRELASLSTTHTEAEIQRLRSENEASAPGNENEIRADYEQQIREMREEAAKEREEESQEAERKMTEMENWYRGQMDNLGES